MNIAECYFIIMHGLNAVKVVNAQQTRIIHHYKKKIQGEVIWN